MDLVVVAALAFAAGAATMYHTSKPVAEAPAPAIRQTDGSLMTERNPASRPPDPPMIPPGYTVTRITTANIEPLAPIEPGRGSIAVQFTEIQGPGGSRMVVSSEDGRILGGSDWTGPRVGLKTYRWQALAVRAWTPGGGTWGGSIGYTRGPVVASITAIPGQVQLAAGFRW